MLFRLKTAVSHFNEKSFDLQQVGKEKSDPNAMTTRAVVASVGTGCGGFRGYFFPDNNSKSKLLSFNNTQKKAERTPHPLSRKTNNF